MIITKQLSQSIKWVTMLPGELGEIPTTDEAINCDNTTWIIKYLPKSRASSSGVKHNKYLLYYANRKY